MTYATVSTVDSAVCRAVRFTERYVQYCTVRYNSNSRALSGTSIVAAGTSSKYKCEMYIDRELFTQSCGVPTCSPLTLCVGDRERSWQYTTVQDYSTSAKLESTRSIP